MVAMATLSMLTRYMNLSGCKPGKSVNLLLLLVVVVYLLLLLLHAFLTCAKSQQCASQVWLVGQQLDIQSFQMFESQ